MAHKLISRKFYESILHFDESEKAQEYYYMIMSTETGKVTANGRYETIRDQILRVYAMLFCDDMGIEAGQPAGLEEVAGTGVEVFKNINRITEQSFICGSCHSGPECGSAKGRGCLRRRYPACRGKGSAAYDAGGKKEPAFPGNRPGLKGDGL